MDESDRPTVEQMGLNPQDLESDGSRQAKTEDAPVQNTIEQRAEKMGHEITLVLKNDLESKSVSEIVMPITPLFQDYSTDCGIACDRMAITYFGIEDTGTDRLVAMAHEMGLSYLERQGADGQVGPVNDPATSQNLLREKFGISKNYSFGTDETKVKKFTNALLNSCPIVLSISFHDLHPEDPSEMKRNHAVLVKGYGTDSKGNLQLVVNDPKPGIGGELIMDQELLEKALVNGFNIYEKEKQSQ